MRSRRHGSVRPGKRLVLAARLLLSQKVAAREPRRRLFKLFLEKSSGSVPIIIAASAAVGQGHATQRRPSPLSRAGSALRPMDEQNAAATTSLKRNNKKRPAPPTSGDATGAPRDSDRAKPTLLSIIRLVELQTAPQQPGLPDLASSLPVAVPTSSRHKIALVLAEFMGPSEKRPKG